MEISKPFFFFFTLVSSSSDVDLLLRIVKPSLQGNTQSLLLASWNTSTPLCQWRGLKWVFSNATLLLCDDVSTPQYSTLSLAKDPSLHLYSLQLPSANLSGSLPKELAEFSMLRSLYLNVNSLSGTLPLELGYSSMLAEVDLSSNLLTGGLPPSVWNLCDRLIALRLHSNALSGNVPDPALPNVTCRDLTALDLGENKFSGEFLEFVTMFSGLKELDLGENMMSGSVPASLAQLELDKLNLSHNNFSGALPVFGGSKFGVEAFEGNNPALCGAPLRSCGGISARLSPGAIAGIVIGLMTGTVVLASLCIGYVQHKKKSSGAESDYELGEGDDEENGSVGGDGNQGRLILFQGGEHLTLDDVLNATGQVLEKTRFIRRSLRMGVPLH